MPAVRPLTPAEARAFAEALNAAADKAEAAGSDAIDLTDSLSALAGAALDSLEAALNRGAAQGS